MRKRSILGLVIFTGCVVVAARAVDYIEVGGVGTEAQGAGMVFTNLDANPKPEMILMALDKPRAPNNFRFKIGWNLENSGHAASWDALPQQRGMGEQAQGAGMAITNLDLVAQPELIIMAYDNPDGENSFKYRVGFNLDRFGIVSRWSEDKVAPGVGWEGQGAGIVVTNLDDNIRPEMILMAYDNPEGENSFRYRIGWNLNRDGDPTGGWSNLIEVPGVGTEAQGAGIEITHVDRDPRPDMILMAYESAGGPFADNTFRYKIGFNLDRNGVAASWGPDRSFSGVGDESQGADISVGHLGADITFMAYDNPDPLIPRGNTFRYKVGVFALASRSVHLEMDKLENVAWPPASVDRAGATHTPQSIFQQARVFLSPVQNEGGIPDLHPGVPYTLAELDAFRVAHMNLPSGNPRDWNVYAAMLTDEDQGNLGVMFASSQRNALAVFTRQLSAPERYLRTLCHEVGHALNLQHDDGDAFGAVDPPDPLIPPLGRSIMNQTRSLFTDWNFVWSGVELQHFFYHLEDRWRPGSGIPAGSCHCGANFNCR